MHLGANLILPILPPTKSIDLPLSDMTLCFSSTPSKADPCDGCAVRSNTSFQEEPYGTWEILSSLLTLSRLRRSLCINNHTTKKTALVGFTTTFDLCTSTLAQAGAISMDEIVVHLHDTHLVRGSSNEH